MRDDEGYTLCLTHQLPEDQASPFGLFCARCKHRLYTQPPRGRCSACWESQPEAYSLDGQPLFVFTMIWEDYRIRSLHPPGSDVDPRGERLREAARRAKTVPRADRPDKPAPGDRQDAPGKFRLDAGEP